MDDNSTIKFGKYKGQKLIDIPAQYLIWCYEQDWCEEKYPALFNYIHENFEALEMDVREELSHYESEEDFLRDGKD